MDISFYLYYSYYELHYVLLPPSSGLLLHPPPQDQKRKSGGIVIIVRSTLVPNIDLRLHPGVGIVLYKQDFIILCFRTRKKHYAKTVNPKPQTLDTDPPESW